MHEVHDKYLFSHPSDLPALVEALESAKLSGTSTWVDQYEAALAAWFAVRFAVAVSSGSAAIHAALFVLGVDHRSEVLVPASAPIPTVLPILTLRARPVVVDTAKCDFAFDADDLVRKISERTKAAVSVPVWGYPYEQDAALKVLKAAGIPLVEDAAQAHGTLFQEKKAGTIGVVGCFSTHDRKLLATGEGGFVLTNERALYEDVRRFIRVGGLDGIHYGVNYKLSTLQCALGRARLKQLDWQLAQRRTVAKRLLAAIAHLPLAELPIPLGSAPNCSSLLLRTPIDIGEALPLLTWCASRGIPSDILRYKYRPIYHHRLFMDYAKTACPHAEALIASLVMLPVHPGISSGQVAYMADTLEEGMRNLKQGRA